MVNKVIRIIALNHSDHSESKMCYVALEPRCMTLPKNVVSVEMRSLCLSFLPCNAKRVGFKKTVCI